MNTLRHRFGLGLAAQTEGRVIVEWSVAVALVFAIAMAWESTGVAGGVIAGLTVSIATFVVGLGVWFAAFVGAARRSAAGAEIAVASLFFLQGAAPTPVRRRLLGVAAFVAALSMATVAMEPASFLANMAPIGLVGLWGARHGTYPERRDSRYIASAQRHDDRQNQRKAGTTDG